MDGIARVVEGDHGWRHIEINGERIYSDQFPKAGFNFIADKINAALSRKFPMLDGPDIPWALGEEIYYRLYAPKFGSLQTLHRLAERGGFGWAEVAELFKYSKITKAAYHSATKGETDTQKSL